MEIWKSVVGFEDYQVSSLGRIRSITKRKGARAAINDGIISGWIQIVRPNYKRQLVSFRKGKETTTKKVHQVVLEAFVGQRQGNQEVLHRNGNALDNRLENLRWGTHKENIEDSRLHGKNRNPPIHYGETHPRATISDADVAIIRRHKFKRGDQVKFAKKFKVAEITISRIRKSLSRLHDDGLSL